jgi:hypothetical protein
MKHDDVPEAESRDTERLEQEMKALFQPPGGVPHGEGARVLMLAEQQRLRKLRRRVLVRMAGLAAAGILCGIGLSFLLGRLKTHEQPVAPARGVTMDINGDGRVDILDALALAQYVKAGAPYKAEWDLNGNGILDRGDAVVLASAVVKIGEQPDVRYYPLDVYLDTGGRSLAAYQLVISDASGTMRILGVHGGTASAFKEAPFYDSTALARSRIILAAFSTSDDLPKGRVNVARLYVQSPGGGKPKPQAELVVAGASDGQRIAATPILVAEDQ